MKSKVRMIFDPWIKWFFGISITDKQRWDDWRDEKASAQNNGQKQQHEKHRQQNKKQEETAMIPEAS